MATRSTGERTRREPALDAGLSGLGAWAPVVYVALYAAATVVFLPGSVFALAGGALFGAVWGAVLNLTAATLGAGAAFLVARCLAGDWVARRTAGRRRELFSPLMRHYGTIQRPGVTGERA